MLSLVTQCRLMALSAWRPPEGVRRVLAVDDEGIIDVLFESGPFQGGIKILPGVPIGIDVFRELDRIARELLAEATRAGHKQRKAADRLRKQADDLRFARAMKAARDRFDDGVRKATTQGG